MIRSGTFFDGSKGFVLFSKEYKKSEPFPYRKKFGFCCCGAPPGTRTLGPLIKRNQRATIVNSKNYADSLFLSFYHKFAFCICCILCSRYSLLHPLSSCSGVQKVCKNVQSQNQPLKQASSFYAKPEKRPGSSPIRQLQSCLFRLSIKCTSTTTIHGRDLDNRTDTTLYRKKFPMNKLLSCHYNWTPTGWKPGLRMALPLPLTASPSKTSTAILRRSGQSWTGCCTISLWSMHSLCWVGRLSTTCHLAATMEEWKID